MKKTNWRLAAKTLPAWLLAGIFLFAGIEKVSDPPAFAFAINNYQMLPEFGVKLAALLFPAWEIASGLALLLPRWRLAGAALAGSMSLMFFGAIGSAFIRGLDIRCGCFGMGSGKADAWALLLDAGLLLLAMSVMLTNLSFKILARFEKFKEHT
jgi:hypothetical protein